MDIPRYWRLRNQRYRLEGTECTECGERNFPPRCVCAKCKSEQLKPFYFSGKGKIYSFSTIHQALDTFDKDIPYSVALVKLNEGPLITTQLADVRPDEIQIGQAVEMIIRKIYEDGENGPIQYGYKFRPQINE